MVSPTSPASASDPTTKNAASEAAARNKASPTSVTQPAVPFAKMLARLASPPPPLVKMNNALPAARPTRASGAGASQARERREREEATERGETEQTSEETSARVTRHRDLSDEGDALSSWSRHCADLAPPTLTPAMAATKAVACEGSPAARAHASLEELLPGMVKRVAWSGDGKRGAVRMELGAGELAGSTLLVEAEGPSVRVTLDAPAGVSTAAWQQTIRSRLEARGLNVESVEVK